MSLIKKTLSGFLWTFIQQFSIQLINFGVTVILARILLPEEFGLIAMLTVFISIGNNLMDSGLASSLIRSADLTQKDYSTVFFFNLAGSAVMYGLIYLSAPYIASFYQQDVLALVLRVYAIGFIINAFYSVQNARLTKEMNFKIQMTIQIPAVLIGGLLGVVLAMKGYGVWSLVWMNLFQSFLSTVMHWIYSGWVPSLVFDKKSFLRHFNFGYKMTLTGIMDTLYRNIYVLIIGKYYSVLQLGFYSRAESVSQLPTSNISAIINKVTYPMFASINDNDTKLKLVYKTLMQQVLFWNAPILIFLAVIGEPLFTFLFTVKWLPAVPYFQILCLSGVMYPLHSYNLNILKVKGRSDLILKLEIIKKSISVIGILCVIPFGIYGLLYVQLLFSFISYYINSLYSGKLLDYPISEQITDIMPTIIISLSTGLICYLFDQMFLKPIGFFDITRIIIDGLFFFLLYIGCSTLLKLTPIHDFKHLILKR
ncbi:lipopolysaccharide biosynthesis protein [Pedobacter immunditicola]|uniref:lipopolysaccharide biosynthesis protein n=1 Tax=Pedobacter immunditicola TaxID=3133440 RepID=UPI0030AEB0A6